MRLTKTLRMALAPAVLFGWRIEVNRSGRAIWDGDTALPFRSHKSLETLVSKKLMEQVHSAPGWQEFRATPQAREYLCRRCHRGRIYAEGPNGYDHPVAVCDACDGVGLLLTPNGWECC